MQTLNTNSKFEDELWKEQTQLGCPLFDYGAVVLRCLFFIKNVLHIQKFENKPILN